VKVYESTGRTTEEAISNGLIHLGVAIGDVRVDILEEGSKGLFGLFGSRSAKVRLTVKEEEEGISDTLAIFANSLDTQTYSTAGEQRQEKNQAKGRPPLPRQEPKQPPAVRQNTEKAQPRTDASMQTRARAEKEPPVIKPAAVAMPLKARTEIEKPANVKPVTPAARADRDTPSGQAQEFIQNLTKLMGVNVEVYMTSDAEGNIRANMVGDTLGILIGRRGETLDALQYLTSLLINKGRQEYTRVTLDTEDYRAKREEALVRLANRMASRAQKTGRKVAMEPMNPYERRILHSALQNNPAVTTHSEGEEPNRHVVITLNTSSAKLPEADKETE
jgi:spoIIIJ-associated protein